MIGPRLKRQRSNTCMKQKTESAGHRAGGRCSLTAERNLLYDTGCIDGVNGLWLQVLAKQGARSRRSALPALETNTLAVLHQNLLWLACSLVISCRGCMLFVSDRTCGEGKLPCSVGQSLTEQSAGPDLWLVEGGPLNERSSCKQLCKQLQATMQPPGTMTRCATEQFRSTLPLQSLQRRPVNWHQSLAQCRGHTLDCLDQAQRHLNTHKASAAWPKQPPESAAL